MLVLWHFFLFRAEMHHKAEALEALLEAQRQRAAILHTENEDLRARMAESELVEAALREKVADCEAKSVRTGNSFQAMRLFLEQYRSQMESSVLQMQQRMLEASQRLRDMEARVQSAAQRVQLGAAVVAQNNVKRRNAAAVASVRSIVAAGAGASSTSVSPQGQGPAGGGGSAEEAWASGLRSLDPEVCGRANDSTCLHFLII
jgi:cobalamin biosynthesis Mg chelatase CobN